ncbi:MAG TPA: patatin, partial [Flavobacteriaceae bacterium]|nr:patatin [Flavobacteriaceae bacterium]
MKNIFGLILFFCSFAIFGQAQEQPEDLKVGLVLSGGGAKGLAHIGALKVIEEAGVRIDYIGGTSMGAIIGSLYASGYSAKQLDSIFKATNFNALIQDDLPRGVKSFYEREDSERYAVTLPFDHFKIGFPSGLSKGQNIYNLMAYLMSPVEEIEDFSELPIPFFCMGTNIETGEEVLLDRGSLPQAVSASGAIPSLFSPVEINGKLISDGGITNNYPIEELKKRGVDFIIGVDVQDSLVNRKKLKSAFEIMTQVNNFRTIKDMKNKRSKTDLYIQPDIREFTILSFEEGDAIIEQGKIKAEEFKADLEQLAKLQNISVERIHRNIQLSDSIHIADIHISGNSNYPRNYIRGKLKIDTDTKISYRDLGRAINNLSATGNFKRIEYELLKVSANKQDLNLIVTENSNNTSLRLALHYDELYRSAALLNLTRKSLLLKNDIISLDFIAGDNFRYDARYYVDKGSYWSIGLNSRFDQFGKNVPYSFIENNFDLGDYNINQVDIDYRDFTNQIYAETFFLKSFKLGLGGEHKYTQLETETIIESDNNQEIPFTILEESNLFSAFGYLEYDKYDNAYFPCKGLRFMGDFHAYVLESKASYDFTPFYIARGYIGYAFSPFKNVSFRLQSETGFRVGETEMNALDFYLGGYGNHLVNNLVPFYGYDFLSISGDSYIKSLVEVDFEPFDKNHLILGYNFANVENDLYSTGNFFSTPDYTG